MSTASVTRAPAASRTLSVLSWIIFVLALAGIVFSGITLNNHYKKDKSEFCDFGDTFNCDLVNRGPFSMVGPALGFAPGSMLNKVPVAATGIAGYALLAFLAPFARRCRWTALLVLLGALVGMAFALRLTYIEARILFTWCIYCLASQITIGLILLLSIWQTALAWRRKN
jgi:uncharacterized membrane protein